MQIAELYEWKRKSVKSLNWKRISIQNVVLQLDACARKLQLKKLDLRVFWRRRMLFEEEFDFSSMFSFAMCVFPPFLGFLLDGRCTFNSNLETIDLCFCCVFIGSTDLLLLHLFSNNLAYIVNFIFLFCFFGSFVGILKVGKNY